MLPFDARVSSSVKPRFAPSQKTGWATERANWRSCRTVTALALTFRAPDLDEPLSLRLNQRMTPAPAASTSSATMRNCHARTTEGEGGGAISSVTRLRVEHVFPFWKSCPSRLSADPPVDRRPLRRDECEVPVEPGVEFGR